MLFFGVTKTLGLKTSSGKIKSCRVEIPAGIQNNQKIRLKGLGKKSLTGGRNGDLLVKINIQDTSKFKLQGNDIIADLLLTPWEAGLSRKIKFEGIDGEVTIFIPEGTQSGEEIVLQGKGYPNSMGNRGNLILQTKIVIPQKLTDDQKELFKKMEKIIDFNPRR